MFCPKCGTETAEGQKFCKSCGTNMQVVSDAMTDSDDSLGIAQLKTDVETLKKTAVEFARDLKVGIVAGIRPPGRASSRGARTRRIAQQTREERRRMPKPREWLRYSWQHNLRDGLINLLAGAGLGGVLYIIGHAAIGAGTIADLEAQAHTHGFVQVTSLLWLLGAVRALKGVGQIIYAAFFADSLATLTQRFLPPVIAEPQPLPKQPAVTTNELTPEPPPSVTEHTTQIFENAQTPVSDGQRSSA